MPYERIEYNYADGGWVLDREGRLPDDELGIRIIGIGPDGLVSAMYSDIPGSSWNATRLEAGRQWVQDRIDTRLVRADLDPNHPYIVDGDPAQDWLFWDGADVVERLIEIRNVVFDVWLMFEMHRFNRRVWVDGHR